MDNISTWKFEQNKRKGCIQCDLDSPIPVYNCTLKYETGLVKSKSFRDWLLACNWVQYSSDVHK